MYFDFQDKTLRDLAWVLDRRQDLLLSLPPYRPFELFTTSEQLTDWLQALTNGACPLHPPQVSSTLRRTQVYRFNEDEGGAPVCVSCPALDAVVRGPATFDLRVPENNGFGTRISDTESIAEARVMSVDGRRVYFTTTSTLDPRDQNPAADVYEWSADRGSAVLLSSGDPESRGDAFLDVDASGKNVFFTSEIPLTASDFAAAFVKAVLAERPDALIRLGTGSRVLPNLARLPSALRDRLLMRRFGLADDHRKSSR